MPAGAWKRYAKGYAKRYAKVLGTLRRDRGDR